MFKLYTSTYCDYKATSRKILRIISIHENVQYPCSQCEHEATQKESLINHKNTIHEKISYQCDQCNYQASGKGSIKDHVIHIHEGVMYKCNQCDHKTAQTVHDDISYFCDQCEHKGNLSPI